MLDLVWTKGFFLRRFSLFTLPEWQLLIKIDTCQCWCISPRIYFYLGRIRTQFNFAPAWWLPEIYFRIGLNKYNKSAVASIYTSKWIANLKHYFAHRIQNVQP
jgi:hypothetical protein